LVNSATPTVGRPSPAASALCANPAATIPTANINDFMTFSPPKNLKRRKEHAGAPNVLKPILSASPHISMPTESCVAHVHIDSTGRQHNSPADCKLGADPQTLP
jgi:hypothetical protein